MPSNQAKAWPEGPWYHLLQGRKATRASGVSSVAGCRVVQTIHWWAELAYNFTPGRYVESDSSPMYEDGSLWVGLTTLVENQSTGRKLGKKHIRKFTRGGVQLSPEEAVLTPEDAESSPDPVWNTNASAQRARERAAAQQAEEP